MSSFEEEEEVKSTLQQEEAMRRNSLTAGRERKKGGVRTIPFIIGNETFEKVASYGLLANMMLYIMKEYNMKPTTGIGIMFLWNALSNFTPIIGAFLSDSFLGRFRVIAIGTLASLTGMTILLITAIVPQARPPHCHPKLEKCVTADTGQRLLLFSSFALMSIGAGGIRPCSMAFGADQVNNPLNPNNARVLQTFFSWYYASVGISLMVAITLIVYIQDKFGWIIGFAVPLGLMLLSTAMFFGGSRIYVMVKGDKNLLSGFAHVVVAAWKNRHFSLPPSNSNFDGWCYHTGSKLVAPTEKLRFLNKACLIKSPRNEITQEGVTKSTWEWDLCTVRQVEELKAFIKVLPIWSTGIFLATVISQHHVWITQALSMDRHLGSGSFQIPAGSFAVFTILTLTLWVTIYDRLIIPVAPKGLSFKQRIGAGLAVGCLATSVAAVVERQRRDEAVSAGKVMSATWLVPQFALAGLAEGFNAIGQIEFYYSQFPRSMASIAVALLTLGMAFGNLFGALLVRVVNDVTGRSEGAGWLADELNEGRYDKYFWLLTFMGLVNFCYFCWCAWAYGDCEDMTIWDDDEESHSHGVLES